MEGVLKLFSFFWIIKVPLGLSRLYWHLWTKARGLNRCTPRFGSVCCQQSVNAKFLELHRVLHLKMIQRTKVYQLECDSTHYSVNLSITFPKENRPLICLICVPAGFIDTIQSFFPYFWNYFMKSRQLPTVPSLCVFQNSNRYRMPPNKILSPEPGALSSKLRFSISGHHVRSVTDPVSVIQNTREFLRASQQRDFKRISPRYCIREFTSGACSGVTYECWHLEWHLLRNLTPYYSSRTFVSTYIKVGPWAASFSCKLPSTFHLPYRTS